ncbi:MAG: glycosyltransferase family 2 protein [Opitutaceae bacterium]|nr:glycosyltransferase family 2 protein [Opitutaceae bacterium]
MNAQPEEKPVWICVSPTKNESWVIDRFLGAAGTWADHIFVADQGSTDGTREAITRAPKSNLLSNESQGFYEHHRQTLLLSAARKIPGKRIIVSLDADETLSAHCRTSPEWAKIEAAAPGTILRFRWVNILPGFERAWVCPGHVPLGYVDDGVDYVGGTIHGPRLPQPKDAPVLDLNDIVVLHFQYILWDRMASKQRWYQAWEFTRGKAGPLDIFRQYNHMHGGWEERDLCPVRPEWLESFDRAGIDYRSLKCEPVTWWDREVAGMLKERGPEYFRRIAIWDYDWNAFARKIGMTGVDFSDPRSKFERVAHSWLKRTQKRRGDLSVRAFEKLLRLRGW